MADLYAQKFVKEFKEKRPLYEEFCGAMNKLMAELLNSKKYKHQIFYRVKSLQRLEQKIINKKRQKKIYRNLSEIEDLAGIRIIFYLESDKEKFLEDLEREILIVNIEELEKKSGYRARHVIVALNKKRLALREYKNFENLKCEIQLVSIFNHAWAELEHDWLYKDVHGIRTKNPEKYGFIKKQMEKIFKNYVRKLTSRFEKVAKQLPEKK